MTTLQEVLTNSNPNSLPSAMQELNAGQAFAAITRTRQSAVGGVVAHKIILPNTAKAALILACYAYGTTSGWKTPLAPGSNVLPATTEVSIDGGGNIVFPAADAIAEALVMYVPYQGLQIVTDVIDVATHVGTLLNGRKAQLILSATSLVGTLTGALSPTKRGTAAPATTLVAIGGTTTNGADKVLTAVADAVTRLSVTYLALPGVGSGTGKTIGEALASETQLT